MNLLRLFFIIILFTFGTCETKSVKLEKRALQKSHEKPQAEKWMESFFGQTVIFDQVASLVNLIKSITTNFLSDCTPVILYDSAVEESDGIFLELLFRSYPTAYIHGQVTSNYVVKIKEMLQSTENTCFSYIIFMTDVMKCKDVIGEQSTNKVVIVVRSSQWRVYEFLASEVARSFVNLLVIAQSEKILTVAEELPFILYTHKMFVDGLGASAPIVLVSWKNNNFSRPNINLFPPKMIEGFAGHRFIISIAHQPPFVVKRGVDDNDDIRWDGTEVKLVSLLAEMYNFTTDFREARNIHTLGSGDAVTQEVGAKKANLGVGGIYVTSNRIGIVDVAQSHSQDCAAFITLTSTALPRYRAIMGPFHWTVWLSLTFIYLFAIFPLALSDKHTLKHLIEKPEEIENMFWYVFGTFTNCFTFTGEASWGKSDKVTTRLLVGFYWLFTIITTACYTGSIIAFVTLPIYPETVDTVQQLLSGRFRTGTLDKGGWQHWFENSTDPKTKKLFKNIEFLTNVDSGLKNVTKAFFWPYAYLGSRDELDFIVRTNFSTQSKRSVLHISDDCFVPYGVSIIYPLNSVYKSIINRGIMRAMQSGFIIKFKHDVEWHIMRSTTGKLLQINSGGSTKIQVEDRALTLDDTQGMFLLLGAGFLLGLASLLSEWLGGCFNFCKMKVRRMSTSSIESNPRSYDSPTPREKINSIQYSVHTRLCSIADEEQNGIENKRENEIEQNHVDFILHADVNLEDAKSEFESNTDYDEEIDKIFNIDSLFGECNEEDKSKSIEELVDKNIKAE